MYEHHPPRMSISCLNDHDLHVSYLELEVTGRIIHNSVNLEPLQLDTGFHLPILRLNYKNSFSHGVATLVFHPPLPHRLLSLETSLFVSRYMLKT